MAGHKLAGGDELLCDSSTSMKKATSTIMEHSLSLIDDQTRQRVAKKFNVSFMMAKESLLFTKYATLLELESCHGVDLGPAYIQHA